MAASIIAGLNGGYWELIGIWSGNKICKPLNRLVAGDGFEPPTFGL